MNPRISSNIEKQGTEPIKEGLIDLTALSFDFCTEDSVRDFYDKKLQELEDKEKWLDKNKERLEQNKQKIAQAVEDGLIPDDQPETIWQFKIDKTKEGRERVIEIKNELEGRVDEIKGEVAKRVGKFLPDWSPDKAKIIFEMNEMANFCIDGDNITVDMGRLLFEKNPLEKVKEGITHEVFHLWMSEKTEWSDSKQNEVSDEELKERIIFRIVDEGLAVLISGQPLSEHHKRQGRNYGEYIKESFDAFDLFEREDDRGKLESIKKEEFQNMGHFYVVGNEIIKTMLEHEGIEKFKALIIEAKNNPSIFLQNYKEICNKKPELPA